jgi:two-component system cell cycle sensor histidine kinase/response regulator CckA
LNRKNSDIRFSRFFVPKAFMSDTAVSEHSPHYPVSVRVFLRAISLVAGIGIGWDIGIQLIANAGHLTGQDLILAVAALSGVVVLLGFLMRVLASFVPMADPWIAPLLDAQKIPSLIASGFGQVIATNQAYLDLCKRMGQSEPVALPLLLGHETAVSQALYRLAQAAHEERFLKETVRIEIAGKQQKPVLWHLSIFPLPAHSVHGRSTLWQFDEEILVSPVVEPVYDSLREAAEALDQAPVGYFALNGDGNITQINATLASWLQWDLALFFPGERSLNDIVATHAALFLDRLAHPAEIETQAFAHFPVMLRRADGHQLQVRAVFSAERSGYSDLRVIVSADWFESDHPSSSQRDMPVATMTHKNQDTAKSDDVFFTYAPMAAAVLDRHGLILKANPRFEAVFGALPQASGSPLDVCLATDRRSGLHEALSDLHSGSHHPISFEAPLKDGERSVAMDLVPAHAEASALAEGGSILLFARETTEQRNLQAQFEQAQKMQAVGELAGGIAHDFNNVLQGILGFTDLLLVSHRPTDPSFQDLMQIKQNATRAAGLVRQLLAFSRRQTLRPRLVSLNDAVTDVSHLVRRLLGEAVPLEIKLGRDLWAVMTDPGQFEQAVLNLAVNARDAMPQGGRLSIRTYNITPDECGIVGDGSLPIGDYVGFEIEDSGLGIAPSDLPKIFQPFFTTKDVGKGTGLGLSMVYGFVKQSGGYVFCRSRVGEGTCFVLVLPRHEESVSVALSDPAPAASDMTQPAQPVADMTGAGTILLVEDEDAVRAFAARALTQRGYTVVEAASGVEALEQVAAHPDIDLIVSDVVMPEMDGPTMLRHLREQGANKPIIFVSGYAEDAFARNLPEGEDFGFLPKPFTLKQLVEAVKQALTGQKKAR